MEIQSFESIRLAKTTLFYSDSQILLRYLCFNETLLDAALAPRIHHQLFPMEILYQRDLPEEIISGLKGLGHQMTTEKVWRGFSSITAIGREGNKLVTVNDPIRPGSSSVF